MNNMQYVNIFYIHQFCHVFTPHESKRKFVPFCLFIVAVGKHETHQGKKGRRLLVQGWHLTHLHKTAVVAGVPHEDHVYTCAQTLVHKRVHTHAHMIRKREIWCKQTEKIQDYKTHHTPWMEERDGKKRKFGFTLSSSSLNSNLSLSRSSWTWRAFKARHTVLK